MSALPPGAWPRLLTAAQAALYVGIGNETDFYAHLKFDPTFPRGLRRELPPKPGDATGDAEPRYSHPRWDLRDLDAWVDRQSEPARRASEEVDRLMSERATRAVRGAGGRRGARQGRGGSSGPSSPRSDAA